MSYALEEQCREEREVADSDDSIVPDWCNSAARLPQAPATRFRQTT